MSRWASLCLSILPRKTSQASAPLQGIEHYWPEAGADATEATVQQYMQAPREDKGSPWLTGAVGAAVLGTIGYRRPKAAAMFAGAVAFATAPYFGFMIVTVNRFSKVRPSLGEPAVHACVLAHCRGSPLVCHKMQLALCAQTMC
jgi:hypothetical protein